MPTRRSLDDQILVTLEQASAEERLDVAEHLLGALETLQGANPWPGSPLGAAYATVVGSAKTEKPRRSH